MAGILSRFHDNPTPPPPGSGVTEAPATSEPTAPTPSPVPAAPWDKAEADRLLDQLHRETGRLKATWPRREFPPVVANVVQIAAEVCEAYVQDHEREAARGWDALALLWKAVPWALSLATPKRPTQ